MFQPGDVVHLYSVIAGKPKYHLCVSINGHFLFINSPKARQYPGDFIFPCSEMPFIPSTDNGDSIISVTQIVHFSDQELRRMRATRKGSVPIALLRDLLAFIENTTVLSQSDKDLLLDGLGEWL